MCVSCLRVHFFFDLGGDLEEDGQNEEAYGIHTTGDEELKGVGVYST